MICDKWDELLWALILISFAVLLALGAAWAAGAVGLEGTAGAAALAAGAPLILESEWVKGTIAAFRLDRCVVREVQRGSERWIFVNEAVGVRAGAAEEHGDHAAHRQYQAIAAELEAEVAAAGDDERPRRAVLGNPAVGAIGIGSVLIQPGYFALINCAWPGASWRAGRTAAVAVSEGEVVAVVMGLGRATNAAGGRA